MAVTVSDLQNMRFSGNPQADALLGGTPVWNFWPDGRKVIYYTFDAGAGSEAAKTGSPVTAFNAAQKQSAKQILAYASSVTGITFAEVATSAQADLHFAATNLQGPSTAGLASSGYSYGYTVPGQVLTSLNIEAVVYLDNVEHAGINNNPTAGGSGYEVLLHEVGHALGLSHPFDSSHPLPSAQDNTNNTVMSYTHAGPNKTTFQGYDLLALDWLYGRDGLGGTYGINSTKGPTLTFDAAPAPAPAPSPAPAPAPTPAPTPSPTPAPAPTTPTTPTAPTTPTKPTPAPTPTPTNPNLPTGNQGTGDADLFNSKPATETFNGGAGVDTLVAHGNRGQYTLQPLSGGNWLLNDKGTGLDGIDTLQQIERVRFADHSVALDLNGAAGTAARLISTLLGSDALKNKGLVGAVIKAVDESGATPQQLAELALAAVAGPSATPQQVVALLYANLFGTAADAATVQNLAGLLQSGSYTGASLTWAVASSDLTASKINLVGLSQVGLEYI